MSASRHRLEGLEPDNLLAFLALLGLMRALETARPHWRARVGWTVDDPPVRPCLFLREGADEAAVSEAAAEGIARLAGAHDFGGLRDLSVSPADARQRLTEALADPARAAVWSALASDAAVKPDGKEAEPTPLCLMFGQGHQHFLDRLHAVPRTPTPPPRGSGRNKTPVAETESLREALFRPWERPDATPSFRWDHHEDVRYALRATDPTDPKTKETTQHGANRLAAVGLPLVTVVPRGQGARTRLVALGGRRDARGAFSFVWPIWRDPVTLAAIRALLAHPRLDDPAVRSALGVVELRAARRISAGKFMNFTRAEAE